MASTRDIVPGFAARLKAARESAGLTQVELAQKAGVGELTVSRLEREDRAPSLRVAVTLAESLDLSMDYFSFGERKKFPRKVDPVD